MARRGRPLEQALAALSRARDAESPLCAQAVCEALARDPARAVAKAAEIARARGLDQVMAPLLSAFDRFLERPAQSDPGCVAKTAIVEALAHLGHDDSAVFLVGIRHVQMEPVFGGRVDTAVDLRGASAFGLVAMGYPDVLEELADLLGDPEPPARISAARALAGLGSPEGVPLLRLRLRVSDTEPRVLAECFLSLLRLQPSRSLPFVAEQLDSADTGRAEAAAVALGESRLAEAFPFLRDWTSRSVLPGQRRTGLLALGALRCAPAFDYLLQVLEESRGEASTDALAGLAQGPADRSLRERVEAVVLAHGEPRLLAELRRRFPAERG